LQEKVTINLHIKGGFAAGFSLDHLANCFIYRQIKDY